MTDFPNLEEAALTQLFITAGGHQIEEPIDEAFSKELIALWTELGIKEIE